MIRLTLLMGLCMAATAAAGIAATVYEVGPGKPFANIGDVPWESLVAGDTVRIHWRAEPYREKWVLCAQGTEEAPIRVVGVPNAAGELPVIDGRDATTRSALNYWNEARGVIKIGGANVPSDRMPRYLIIESLDIRSGRPPYRFTGRHGRTDYAENSASIYVEKGEHITIRNCVLHDSGMGLFIAYQAKDVLVEGCYLYDNGIEGSFYEHNSYTEANGIVFQFNRFGPLRPGCLGNNLKDRSAGTVIRYNWIEGGNRQLDLVDSDHLADLPTYRTTYVYGNVLIEPGGEGNSQIGHYGGDSGTESQYRKGTLYFYNNTVISTRSDNTTLLRLSTDDETCDLRNNVVYVTAPGRYLAISDAAGEVRMRHNWLKGGWVKSHDRPNARVVDLGGNLTGQDPGFFDFDRQQFWLRAGSPCVDAGTALAPEAAGYPVSAQYVKHQRGEARQVQGPIDIGAYEYQPTPPGSAGYPRWDVNEDGIVDILDLALVGLHFGEDYRALPGGRFPEGLGGRERQAWMQALERWWQPTRTSLLPNYPNPCNPGTWFPFQLASGGQVTIRIYDLQGRTIRTLDLGYRPAGVYLSKQRAVHWDGRSDSGEPVASGVYLSVFETQNTVNSRRIALRR